MSPTAATKAASNTTTVRRKAAAAAPAAEAEATAAAAPAQETDNQKRNRLRNEAERHILNLHKDEFDDYAEQLFSKNGLKFNRRLSEAQKAEKKIEELIAEHPELESVLRAKFAADHSPVTDTDPEPEAPNYEADVEALPEAYTEAPVEQVSDQREYTPAPVAYGADGPDYSQDPFAPQQ